MKDLPHWISAVSPNYEVNLAEITFHAELVPEERGRINQNGARVTVSGVRLSY